MIMKLYYWQLCLGCSDWLCILEHRISCMRFLVIAPSCVDCRITQLFEAAQRGIHRFVATISGQWEQAGNVATCGRRLAIAMEGQQKIQVQSW